MMDISEVIKQIPFWNNLVFMYKRVLSEFMSQMKKDERLLCFISETENAASCQLHA